MNHCFSLETCPIKIRNMLPMFYVARVFALQLLIKYRTYNIPFWYQKLLLIQKFVCLLTNKILYKCNIWINTYSSSKMLSIMIEVQEQNKFMFVGKCIPINYCHRLFLNIKASTFINARSIKQQHFLLSKMVFSPRTQCFFYCVSFQY